MIAAGMFIFVLGSLCGYLIGRRAERPNMIGKTQRRLQLPKDLQ